MSNVVQHPGTRAQSRIWPVPAIPLCTNRVFKNCGLKKRNYNTGECVLSRNKMPINMGTLMPLDHLGTAGKIKHMHSQPIRHWNHRKLYWGRRHTACHQNHGGRAAYRLKPRWATGWSISVHRIGLFSPPQLFLVVSKLCLKVYLFFLNNYK